MFNFEKEKDGAIEIEWNDEVAYSDNLKCWVLKSTGKPLDGKYYLTAWKQIRYLKNGKYHRDDNLPAVICDDGSLFCYYVNGKQHRIDGPARIYGYKGHRWWINGWYITNEVINEWIKEHNIPLDWNIWTESDKMLFALHWSDYNGE